MTDQSPYTARPFTPTEQQLADLLAWFARYDAHAAAGEVEAMADMAIFPLVVISNDSAGECVAQQWDRAAFVQAMATGTGADAPRLDNRREPVFLGPDLAVVVSNTTVTAGDAVSHMRYADVMARSGGQWRFTSMVQAGWGDMMRQYLGA